MKQEEITFWENLRKLPNRQLVLVEIEGQQRIKEATVDHLLEMVLLEFQDEIKTNTLVDADSFAHSFFLTIGYVVDLKILLKKLVNDIYPTPEDYNVDWSDLDVEYLPSAIYNAINYWKSIYFKHEADIDELDDIIKNSSFSEMKPEELVTYESIIQRKLNYKQSASLRSRKGTLTDFTILKVNSGDSMASQSTKSGSVKGDSGFSESNNSPKISGNRRSVADRSSNSASVRNRKNRRHTVTSRSDLETRHNNHQSSNSNQTGEDEQQMFFTLEDPLANSNSSGGNRGDRTSTRLRTRSKLSKYRSWFYASAGAFQSTEPHDSSESSANNSPAVRRHRKQHSLTSMTQNFAYNAGINTSNSNHDSHETKTLSPPRSSSPISTGPTTKPRSKSKGGSSFTSSNSSRKSCSSFHISIKEFDQDYEGYNEEPKEDLVEEAEGGDDALFEFDADEEETTNGSTIDDQEIAEKIATNGKKTPSNSITSATGMDPSHSIEHSHSSKSRSNLVQRASLMNSQVNIISSLPVDNSWVFITCNDGGKKDDLNRPNNANDPLQFDFMDIPVEQICHDLTVLDLQLFCKIPLYEFKNYQKKGKCDPSSALMGCVNHFNNIALWVSAMVLEHESPGSRAKVIAYFLRVVYCLRDMGNFNSMMAIYSAIIHSTLSRLKYTFERLDPRSQRLLEEFKVDLSPINNHISYRKRLKEICNQGKSCVPFFGVMLRDLIYLGDVPDYMHDNVLNVNKLTILGEVLVPCYNFQNQPCLSSLECYYDVIHTVLQPRLTVDQLYSLSMFREPRNRPPISLFPLPRTLIAALGTRGRFSEKKRPIVRQEEKNRLSRLLTTLVNDIMAHYAFNATDGLMKDEYLKLCNDFPFIEKDSVTPIQRAVVIECELTLSEDESLPVKNSDVVIINDSNHDNDDDDDKNKNNNNNKDSCNDVDNSHAEVSHDMVHDNEKNDPDIIDDTVVSLKDNSDSNNKNKDSNNNSNDSNNNNNNSTVDSQKTPLVPTNSLPSPNISTISPTNDSTLASSMGGSAKEKQEQQRPPLTITTTTTTTPATVLGSSAQFEELPKPKLSISKSSNNIFGMIDGKAQSGLSRATSNPALCQTIYLKEDILNCLTQLCLLNECRVHHCFHHLFTVPTSCAVCSKAIWSSGLRCSSCFGNFHQQCWQLNEWEKFRRSSKTRQD